MSDETKTPRNEGPDLTGHYCDCGAYGGFGFSVGRAPTKWWCAEHYPHWPNRVPREAEDIAKALAN